MNDWYIEDTRQPKDEPEAEYCESCGQPMELCTKGYTHFTCVNLFCPEKFQESTQVVQDMANHIVEVEQELADTKNDLKYANARIANLKTRLERAEKLTQNQQGEE